MECKHVQIMLVTLSSKIHCSLMEEPKRLVVDKCSMRVHSHNFCNIFHPKLHILMSNCLHTHVNSLLSKSVCELQAYSTYPPLTHGERRTLRNVKDPPANWGATFCAIYLCYLRLERILCSRVSLKWAAYPEGPFIGQLR